MNTFLQWRELLEQELTDNIIPFWMRFSIDLEYGGYLTCLEQDGTVYDTYKQMWMQWREVYMFAALFNSRFSDPRYLQLARHGFDFLSLYGRKSAGNYAYMLDRKGRVLAEKADGMEIFSGSFAAVACAELFRATGEKQFKEEAFTALEIYRAAVASAEANKANIPDGWGHLAHPMIELNTRQVMRNAFGSGIQTDEIDRCIEKIFRFRHPEKKVFLENAPASGGFDLNSQQGRFTNPGHALEGMAFILEELRLRRNSDPALVEHYLPQTLDAVKTSFDYGWDDEQGGIWYFRDILGKPVAKLEFMLKAWWPQNEAATAALRAYEMSGDPVFLTEFCKLEEFCWQHLRDLEYGEWFAYAAVDGRQVHSYKGSQFKGFFHIPRHLLNCIDVCDRML